jgi:hypothetical protein
LYPAQSILTLGILGTLVHFRHFLMVMETLKSRQSKKITILSSSPTFALPPYNSQTTEILQVGNAKSKILQNPFKLSFLNTFNNQTVG